MFNIFRTLPEGQIVLIAVRSTREEADQFVQTLNELWPGEYTVEETDDDTAT